ncbi:MAG TPA: hypothetical protein VGD78_03720 [Chthoniobacterales bacterium]
MKKAFLLLAGAVLLASCQGGGTHGDTTEQKPQFGQPDSTIPWNRPEQWEQAGQLGSVPGMNQ